MLAGREPQEVRLREAGCRNRLWDVEVVFDADRHMYLRRGWEQFAHAHDLRLGHFLVLSYDTSRSALGPEDPRPSTPRPSTPRPLGGPVEHLHCEHGATVIVSYDADVPELKVISVGELFPSVIHAQMEAIHPCS